MSLANAISLSRRTLPAFAAEGLFWGAFAAFAPVLKAGIGATDAEFGLVLLVAAVGAMTAMWLAPLFAERAGRYAMAIAAIVLGLSFQAQMWVSGIWIFAFLMLFAGAASGLLDVVMNARLSLIESRAGVSLMNLNHAVFSVAYAGSAIATGFAREVGITPGIVFLALLAGTILLALRMVQSKVEQAPIAGEATPARLPSAVFWGGAIIFVAFMAENAVEGWSALHIERTLQGRAAEGALGPAVLGLTMAVGRFAGQLVVARWNPAMVLVAASVLSAIGSAIAGLAPTPLIAYVGFGVLGLGVSVIAPMAFALIGLRVSDDNRARAISRGAVIGYFGFFVGPPVVGLVAQATSLRISFGLIALILLSVPFLTALLQRR